ncbi:MAG: hypothetical protein JXA99_04675 [Candidatus Lokiarchaeota archaeon]|nr:hypothetical protein [Candidatus Lokiarchaeota archaeon]
MRDYLIKEGYFEYFNTEELEFIFLEKNGTLKLTFQFFPLRSIISLFTRLNDIDHPILDKIIQAGLDKSLERGSLSYITYLKGLNSY